MIVPVISRRRAKGEWTAPVGAMVAAVRRRAMTCAGSMVKRAGMMIEWVRRRAMG